MKDGINEELERPEHLCLLIDASSSNLRMYYMIHYDIDYWNYYSWVGSRLKEDVRIVSFSFVFVTLWECYAN